MAFCNFVEICNKTNFTRKIAIIIWEKKIMQLKISKQWEMKVEYCFEIEVGRVSVKFCKIEILISTNNWQMKYFEVKFNFGTMFRCKCVCLFITSQEKLLISNKKEGRKKKKRIYKKLSNSSSWKSFSKLFSFFYISLKLNYSKITGLFFFINKNKILA